MGGESTKSELISIAHREGFEDVSSRLVTDWTTKGLLAAPRRMSRGFGGGVARTWSQEHVRVFLDTLGLRRAGTSRLADLANVPVAAWLYGGDSYAPLPQVRRAVATWASRHGEPSMRRGREAATRLIAQIEHPDAAPSARRELREYIARVAAYPQGFDSKTLRTLTVPVFDPHGANRTLGPAGVQLRSDSAPLLIEKRILAVQHLGAFSDRDYTQARQQHHENLISYLEARPSLESDSDIGARFRTPAAGEIFGRACLDLITHLGHVQATREATTTDQT